jgi:Ran GTPase-activating protein (RanGAP) involved in mRNA processing and transport
LAVERYTEYTQNANENDPQIAPIFASLAMTYVDLGNTAQAIMFYLKEFALLQKKHNAHAAALSTLWQVDKLLLESTETDTPVAVPDGFDAGNLVTKAQALAEKCLENPRDLADADLAQLENIRNLSGSQRLSDCPYTYEAGLAATEGGAESANDTDASLTGDEVDAEERGAAIFSSNVPPRSHTLAKAKLNRKNENGETKLHAQTIQGNLAVVRGLLAEGATLATTCNYGWTPLHEACNHNFEELVELFLEQPGVKVNTIGMSHVQVQKITPLHDAATNGFASICRMLLEHNADPSLVNNAGQTPLDVAGDRTTFELIKAAGVAAGLDVADRTFVDGLHEDHFDDPEHAEFLGGAAVLAARSSPTFANGSARNTRVHGQVAHVDDSDSSSGNSSGLEGVGARRWGSTTHAGEGHPTVPPLSLADLALSHVRETATKRSLGTPARHRQSDSSADESVGDASESRVASKRQLPQSFDSFGADSSDEEVVYTPRQASPAIGTLASDVFLSRRRIEKRARRSKPRSEVALGSRKLPSSQPRQAHQPRNHFTPVDSDGSASASDDDPFLDSLGGADSFDGDGAGAGTNPTTGAPVGVDTVMREGNPVHLEIEQEAASPTVVLFEATIDMRQDGCSSFKINVCHGQTINDVADEVVCGYFANYGIKPAISRLVAIGTGATLEGDSSAGALLARDKRATAVMLEWAPDSLPCNAAGRRASVIFDGSALNSRTVSSVLTTRRAVLSRLNASNPLIIRANLGGLGLSGSTAMLTLNSFHRNSLLRVLDLSRNRLGDNHLKILACVVAAMPLQTLDVCSNCFTASGWDTLFNKHGNGRASSRSPLGQLEVLRMSCNNLEGLDTAQLLRLFGACPVLRELDLDSCGLSAQPMSDALKLASASKMTNLHKLSLSNNPLLLHGGWLQVLCNSVRSVNISNTSFCKSGPVAGGVLGQPISNTTTVSTLILAGTKCASFAAAYLSMAIRTCQLQEVDASFCGLDGTALECIAAATLEPSSALSMLSLAGNLFQSHKATDALINIVKNAKKLKRLNISLCGMSEIAIASVLRSISSNGSSASHLGSLNASGNPVTWTDTSAIESALPTLRTLDLSGHHWRNKALKLLVEQGWLNKSRDRLVLHTRGQHVLSTKIP